MTDTVTPTQADLIERLREGVHGKSVALTDDVLQARLHEAADEIARLRDVGQQMLFAFAEGVDWSDDQRKAYEDFDAALSAQPIEQALPSDVARLVIAARTMAFGDWHCEGEDYEVARKELDAASEAFASRVEWPDTPSEQEDDDLPEQIGTCENCRAIIRDGDNYIMDDHCVCLCSACAPSEQEGGE